ncbi:uncharacterized protein LOC107264401 isoform X2 [Cephus cinctus]|uniref:Uncharacterized protein LOC107264401 isoform X2 n=1 Tax=Cephus cinctus TaxID=211228 RepID=A0AAJ7BK59_CEPCN|nr:uncharacterized protein LOC107264401 isoform X2 [Cephus cinctus]
MSMMISVFATCFLLLYQIWVKHCQNDMQTIVLESSEYRNDFPSVTFCPQRPMTEERINKILQRMILPTGLRASKFRHNIRHYHEFLAHTKIDNATIFEMINILKINNMTMNDLINDLIDPCESFLHSCYFDERKISCSHYFKKIMAARRYCCTFNNRFYSDKNENTYRPKTKSVKYSPYSGLVLRFNENRFGSNTIDNNETKSSVSNENKIWICVLNSYESLSGTLINYAIQPGKELHIQVEVSVKYAGNDLHNDCVDGDVEERPYVPFYSVSNCKLSSKIQKAYQHCNCIPYFYAYGLVNHSKEICDIEKTICLNDNHNDIWRDKQNSKYYYESLCPSTCKIFNLRKTTTDIPINGGDFACSRIYENITNCGAILRVYLKTEISNLFKQEDVKNEFNYFDVREDPWINAAVPDSFVFHITVPSCVPHDR